MRRLTGWIVAGIVAAVVEFWWGWVLYAAPGYVPDGNALTISIWLGWAWIAIFVVTLYFVRWRAVAAARQRHLRFIGRRCGFLSPTVVIY
jgi:hypothetical protein